jgi:hypothetical protein
MVQFCRMSHIICFCLFCTCYIWSTWFSRFLISFTFNLNYICNCVRADGGLFAGSFLLYSFWWVMTVLFRVLEQFVTTDACVPHVTLNLRKDEIEQLRMAAPCRRSLHCLLATRSAWQRTTVFWVLLRFVLETGPVSLSIDCTETWTWTQLTSWLQDSVLVLVRWSSIVGRCREVSTAASDWGVLWVSSAPLPEFHIVGHDRFLLHYIQFTIH